jgi:hypothetical protein
VKFDIAQQLVHVTRAIESYVTEPYWSSSNVVQTHETRKWVAELVGTIELKQFRHAGELVDELICRLFQAVVGTSRLSLVSVEAPLPDFSLGELAYCHRAGDLKNPAPMRTGEDLLNEAWNADLARSEQVKLVEALLRSTPAEGRGNVATALRARLGRLELSPLIRDVFNDASLTPYTDFVPKTLDFVELLVRQGALTAEQQTDLLSYWLRQIGRHLTAYDLVTFHHRGANYPDALLLDATLKRYLGLIDCYPHLFLPSADDESNERYRKRQRRRALRQGWYFRKHYEGLLVPEAPTSPGENRRCLPAPFPRVPDEQIEDTTKRPRRLFDNDPLTSYASDCVMNVVQQSFQDLEQPDEIIEFGMATFLDRPLRRIRYSGPDQSPLMSYTAFSLSMARARLSECSNYPEFINVHRHLDPLIRALDELEVPGISGEAPFGPQTPGNVALTDAWRVAPDFRLLRTTRRSMGTFLALFDWSSVREQFPKSLSDPHLLLRLHDQETLILYDRQLQPRLALAIDGSSGYRSRAGIDFPVNGLRAAKVCQADGSEVTEDLPVAIA